MAVTDKRDAKITHSDKPGSDARLNRNMSITYCGINTGRMLNPLMHEASYIAFIFTIVV